MTSAHVVDPPKILGIGGSIRARSAGESALRYCLGMAEHAGAVVEIMTARDLALPMYDPSVGASVTGAEHFLDSVNRADALLIATPPTTPALQGWSRMPWTILKSCEMPIARILTGKPSAVSPRRVVHKAVRSPWRLCDQSSMPFAAGPHPWAP